MAHRWRLPAPLDRGVSSMAKLWIFPVGVLALLGLTAAAKAANESTATTPKKPVPRKPPTTASGLPADVDQLIKDARASNDPAFIRQAAAQLADKYGTQFLTQAAYLLALATDLEPEEPRT